MKTYLKLCDLGNWMKLTCKCSEHPWGGVRVMPYLYRFSWVTVITEKAVFGLLLSLSGDISLPTFLKGLDPFACALGGALCSTWVKCWTLTWLPLNNRLRNVQTRHCVRDRAERSPLSCRHRESDLNKFSIPIWIHEVRGETLFKHHNDKISKECFHACQFMDGATLLASEVWALIPNETFLCMLDSLWKVIYFFSMLGCLGKLGNVFVFIRCR